MIIVYVGKIMDIETFIRLFTEQLEETDAAQIDASTKFHDLDEYSSLLALTIIAMVDEEYDVILKGEDLRNALTIEDLFNIIKERKK